MLGFLVLVHNKGARIETIAVPPLLTAWGFARWLQPARGRGGEEGVLAAAMSAATRVALRRRRGGSKEPRFYSTGHFNMMVFIMEIGEKLF